MIMIREDIPHDVDHTRDDVNIGYATFHRGGE
jgi:hypothetical protein